MLLTLWPLFEIQSTEAVNIPEVEILKELVEIEILLVDVSVVVIRE